MTTVSHSTFRIPHFSLTYRPILAIILGLGILLPLPSLAGNPLHHDDALYAYWGRLIAGNQDPMLNTVAVDKPPLFIYTVALFFKLFGFSEAVVRLPSLGAHLLTIGLSFSLGRTLYNEQIGLLGALLVAVSPYTILFAPTALTDPLLVAWVVFAAWGAAGQRPVWAGLGLGLAVASKQQGLFFLPLVVGLLVLGHYRAGGNRRSNILLKSLSQFLLIFSMGLVIPLIWDLNRAYRPGFWLQSSLSYGGLTPAVAQSSERLISFLRLLGYFTASPVLNALFLAGLPLLLLSGRSSSSASTSQQHADRLLSGFCLAFVLLHALFTFQVWDRYLLGLIPFLSLLLARILHLPAGLLKPWPIAATVVAFALVISLMAKPIRLAVNGAYPLGGDHGAFAGAPEVAAYLRRHAGANVTLYHRWLGTHWRVYLFNFPYDFRFWQSAADLAQQAGANAAGVQYIAFPAWKSTTAAQLALSEVNLALVPVFQTIRADGTPAIFLYKIEQNKIEQKPR